MNKRALLEAALFMANDPLSVSQLSKTLILDEENVLELVGEFKSGLVEDGRGLQLLESEVGYQLRVKPEYMQKVRGLTPFKDLNKGLLRVLALIAYKQPITQSQIVKVIGNRTYTYTKDLEQRGLIKGIKSGRTKALVATKGFADYFGLGSVEDTKKLFEGIKIGGNKISEVKSDMSSVNKIPEENIIESDEEDSAPEDQAF